MARSGYTLFQRQNTDGSFTWYYNIPKSVTGTIRLKASTHTDDKELAHAIALKALKNIRDKEIHGRRRQETFNCVSIRYWEEHAKNLKSNESIKYHLLKLFEYFGKDTMFHQIDTQHVKSFINWRKKQKVTKYIKNKGIKELDRYVSNAYVNRELATLSKMYSLAVDWEIEVSEINFTKLKLIEEDRDITYLSPQEIDKLIACAEQQHLKNVLNFYFLTGQRITSILDCRWENVHLDKGYITFRVKSKKKEGKLLYVPIHDELRKFLLGLGVMGSGYLFTYKDKKIASIKKSLNTALKKAGINLPLGQKTHVMRHSFVMNLLNKGVDIHVVQKLVGHEDINTTMRYTHVLDEQKLEAMNLVFQSQSGPTEVKRRAA